MIFMVCYQNEVHHHQGYLLHLPFIFPYHLLLFHHHLDYLLDDHQVNHLLDLQLIFIIFPILIYLQLFNRLLIYLYHLSYLNQPYINIEFYF